MVKENEIEIGNKIYQIKPVKMKYIKENMFFTGYLVLKADGFLGACRKYADMESCIENFLKSIFDVGKIDDNLIDNIDNDIINEIIKKVEKINDIKEDMKSPNKKTPVKE